MGTNLGDGIALLNTLALTTDTAFDDLQNEWDELLNESDQHIFFCVEPGIKPSGKPSDPLTVICLSLPAAIVIIN